MSNRELVSILESERGVLYDKVSEYKDKIGDAVYFERDHLFDILNILLNSYDRVLLSLKDLK